jgi:hypothetical protein
MSMDGKRDAEQAYRHAFEEFAKKVQHAQELTTQPHADPQAVETALLELERAHVHYDICRDQWLKHLLPEPSRGRDVEHAHDACVRIIAELLWQSAGRPDGRADEDWRKAEEIVKQAAAPIAA